VLTVPSLAEQWNTSVPGMDSCCYLSLPSPVLLQGAKQTPSKDPLKIRNLEGKLAQLTANSKKMEKECHLLGFTLVPSNCTSSPPVPPSFPASLSPHLFLSTIIDLHNTGVGGYSQSKTKCQNAWKNSRCTHTWVHHRGVLECTWVYCSLKTSSYCWSRHSVP